MKAICASFIILGTLFSTRAESLPPIQTVFVIVMENHNWSDFKGSSSAPYLNQTLLPISSYCGQYHNPPGLHPSEPNYLWLEAGTNFSIFDNQNPSDNHQSTTNHLTSLLARAGISWRTYQEDIMAGYIPLEDTNAYAVRHNPFVYFDDVTGTNDPTYAYGIEHIRPYHELSADLANNTVARYNFLKPNQINDGHDSVPPDYDAVRQTDDWLAQEIPQILHSAAWSNNGAIFITWDEGEGDIDGPIGMIVISPLARGGGYFNNIYYNHSSTLRTFQEIFGVTPLLNDAANATNLADLFCRYQIQVVSTNINPPRLKVEGVIPGATNYVQASADLLNWSDISTNRLSRSAPTNYFYFTDIKATNFVQRFYRVREVKPQ